MIMMALIKGAALCFGLFVAFASAGSRATTTCYGTLGCFSNEGPFNDMPLPWSPEKIDATFALYTRSNRASPQFISGNNRGSFSTSRETKVIIHGFNTDSGSSAWMAQIKDALLNKGDFNLVLVDWGTGAKTGLLNYNQAASNTRVVGAVISECLESLGASPTNVHCIGHSLGAQTCGYVGDRFGGQLRRISGLDPAGPNFKGKPGSARLDPSDAVFVDNIHTHGEGGLGMNFGIGEAIGDVDFFPNGGGVQPGCWNKRRRRSLSPGGRVIRTGLQPVVRTGLQPIIRTGEETAIVQQPADTYGEGISCSHGRAYVYYLESLTSSCGFPAVQCASMDAMKQDRCSSSCGSGGCQNMGYYSNQASARGIFYLTTNRSAPYCRA